MDQPSIPGSRAAYPAATCSSCSGNDSSVEERMRRHGQIALTQLLTHRRELDGVLSQYLSFHFPASNWARLRASASINRFSGASQIDGCGGVPWQEDRLRITRGGAAFPLCCVFGGGSADDAVVAPVCDVAPCGCSPMIQPHVVHSQPAKSLRESRGRRILRRKPSNCRQLGAFRPALCPLVSSLELPPFASPYFAQGLSSRLTRTATTSGSMQFGFVERRRTLWPPSLQFDHAPNTREGVPQVVVALERVRAIHSRPFCLVFRCLISFVASS